MMIIVLKDDVAVLAHVPVVAARSFGAGAVAKCIGVNS